MAKQRMSGTIEDNLQMLEEDLTKAFGQNAAMRMDSPDTLSKIDHWVSSRSLVVDKVLAGGRPFPCSLVPFGRQVEISGPPNAGKTTICAQIIAEVQEKGGLAVITDTEERIDHTYWESLGVDMNKVLNLRADTLEDVFKKQRKAIRLMREKAPNRPMVLLWDSVGGTAMEGVFDEDEDFMQASMKLYGRKAKTIGAGAEILNGDISKSRVCYLYTNHIYTKMNVQFGDPTETPGGTRLKHFATVRLRLKPIGEIVEKDELTGKNHIIGQKVLVKALKNQMAPMRLAIEGAIIGGEGFSNEWTVFEIAKKLKLIKASGSWSQWVTSEGEVLKFQGFNGFLEKIADHENYEELYVQVANAL